MVRIKIFRELALAFDNAVEQPHFEKASFTVNKKIFATLDSKNKRVVVKLPGLEQSVFCSFDRSIIYPVEGAWGKQGWTVVELDKVRKTMLADALTISYHNVSSKKKKSLG